MHDGCCMDRGWGMTDGFQGERTHPACSRAHLAHGYWNHGAPQRDLMQKAANCLPSPLRSGSDSPGSRKVHGGNPPGHARQVHGSWTLLAANSCRRARWVFRKRAVAAGVIIPKGLRPSALGWPAGPTQGIRVQMIRTTTWFRPTGGCKPEIVRS